MIDYMICDGDTGKWRNVSLGFKVLYLRTLCNGLRPLVNRALCTVYLKNFNVAVFLRCNIKAATNVAATDELKFETQPTATYTWMLMIVAEV